MFLQKTNLVNNKDDKKSSSDDNDNDDIDLLTNSHEYQGNNNNNTNKSITHCQSFKRINNILTLYKKWMNEQQQKSIDSEYSNCNEMNNNRQNDNEFYDILKKTNNDNNYNISDLLDDFHYLLDTHSFHDIYNNLDIININNNNNSTNLTENDGMYLARNYRDRSDVDNYVDNYDDLYWMNSTNREIVLQQILDSYYCYYLFSYYLGMIATENEQKQFENCLININNKNIMNGQTQKIKLMKSSIEKKLDWTQSLNDFDEIHHENKFITKVKSWIISDSQNNIKQESLRYSTIKSNELYYDFGCKYFYYDKYKNTSNFYVESKFKTLKEEVTLNEICNINLKDWNSCYYRAVVLGNSKYTKHVRAIIKNKLNEEMYNIPNGTMITLDHLCSILLFCNFQKLRVKFTETYRRLSLNESDQSLVSRHSNFANIGQYLYEIVHIFGDNNNKDTYYHCINDSTSICMTTTLCVKAPFSVTKSQQIILNATFPIYNKNGLILEFEQNDNNNYSGMTPIFDCKYYSDFIGENEILMIGNDEYHTIQFTNFIDLKSFYDLKNWVLLYQCIKALISSHNINTSKFNKKIKQNVIKLIGNEINKNLLFINDDDDLKQEDNNNNNNNNNIQTNPYLDLDLMKGFAAFTPDVNKKFERKYNKKQHSMNGIKSMDYFDNNSDVEDKFDCFQENELPKYIDLMFHGFCINVKSIRLSWNYLNDENGMLFLNILLTFNKFDMIRLDRFVKIFKNIEEIHILGGNTLKLNKKVIDYIYCYISENKNNKNNKSKLSKLVFTNVYNKSGSLTIYSLSHALKKFKHKFNEINCKLLNENSKQENESLVFEW